MKTVKTYSTTVEADLAKIPLDAAGIPSVVVGVPENYVEAALAVLKDS